VKFFLLLKEYSAFENRVLRGIFGHKREEEKGDWRGLYSEELRNLYCLSDIDMVMKLKR
jgi:hypothetical protein